MIELLGTLAGALFVFGLSAVIVRQRRTIHKLEIEQAHLCRKLYAALNIERLLRFRLEGKNRELAALRQVKKEA